MPLRRLELARDQSYATILQAALGQYLSAVTVTATALGGFFTRGFRPPLDMDLSRDARLYAALFVPTGPGPAAANVQIDLAITQTANGVLATNALTSQLVPFPAALAAMTPLFTELLVAGGPAIPAGTLAPGELVGIRIARNGPAAGDTYASTVGIVTMAWLEYSENCRSGMCL